MKHKTIVILIVVLLAASMVLAACGSDDKDDSKQPVINLLVLPWRSAELNVAVVQIILEEELGYTVETRTAPGAEQWDLIAAGDLHASLEVWPNSFTNQIQKYIVEEKSVEDGGELGAVGQSGWYIPGYMLETYPDITDWTSLEDPTLIAALVTEETGEMGRFLGGDPGWNDQEISEVVIENLGLNLQVVAAGTEAAEIDILRAAMDNEEPILFYFWVPHWLLWTDNLYRINLPPYSDECYAVPEEINCDFPPNKLMKIIWPGLADYAPNAYQLLKNFTLTNMDQSRLMAAVEFDGQTVEQAARSWIAENEAIWKPWINEVETP